MTATLAALSGAIALSGTAILLTDRGYGSRVAAGAAFYGFPVCAVLAVMAWAAR